MHRIIVFGNSGSGKSTLAKHLAASLKIAHFDLDTVAWLPTNPPSRMPREESWAKIKKFIESHNEWVVEGCYSDLLGLLTPQCLDMRFLNIPVEECIENARNRPWESHKYPSKKAQDENLSMLIGWIQQYGKREDEFSLSAHQELFNSFEGNKTEYLSRSKIPFSTKTQGNL